MYMVPNAILVIKAEICTGLYDLISPNELRSVANQSMQQGFNTTDRDLFLGHDVQARYNSEAMNAKSSQPRLGGSDLKVDPGGLDACGKQQRWTEGNGGRDEGGDKCPDEGPMQKRAGRTETGIGASAGDVAPHPAQHDLVREESGGKPKTQRASRPAKRAADTVDCVESNQCTAPNGEARREPP
jgi:hypothetical protein